MPRRTTYLAGALALLLIAHAGCTRDSDTPSESLQAPSRTSAAVTVAPGDARRTILPQRIPEAAFREYEGEAFIVLPSRGQYKILNQVGTCVWSMLDGRHTPEQMARIVATEYDVTEEQALSDILDFLEEMGAAGMLADQGPGGTHRIP